MITKNDSCRQRKLLYCFDQLEITFAEITYKQDSVWLKFSQ